MKPYFTKEQIHKIKTDCKISDYLAHHGYEPVKFKNDEWYYSSIGITENTPSFRVNVVKNVYQDYSGNQDATGVCGDILRLVQSLEQCDFLEAINRLSNAEFMPFNFTGNNSIQVADKKKFEIISVHPLKRQSLIDYIESRGIPILLARQYLVEIDYTYGASEFFAIGFLNDLGGYALRSPPTWNNRKGFKGQLSPNYFTTIRTDNETNCCNIFEGFFSCLSCLQFYQTFYFYNQTYVLNSVTNLSKLLPNIPDSITRINLFLDNDDTGKKYVKKMIDLKKWDVVDCSTKYNGHNDFNEFLLFR